MASLKQIERLAEMAAHAEIKCPATIAQAQAFIGLLEQLDDGTSRMAATLAALRAIAGKDAPPRARMN